MFLIPSKFPHPSWTPPFFQSATGCSSNQPDQEMSSRCTEASFSAFGNLKDKFKFRIETTKDLLFEMDENENKQDHDANISHDFVSNMDFKDENSSSLPITCESYADIEEGNRKSSLSLPKSMKSIEEKTTHLLKTENANAYLTIQSPILQQNIYPSEGMFR